MKLFLDGRYYMIKDMTRDDVKALKMVIEKSECERFYGLLSQIDALEKADLL